VGESGFPSVQTSLGLLFYFGVLESGFYHLFSAITLVFVAGGRCQEEDMSGIRLNAATLESRCSGCVFIISRRLLLLVVVVGVVM